MKNIITTISFLMCFCALYSQTPNAQFTASSLTVCIGNPVSFTNQSTSPTPIINYTWDFGDGSSATTANTSHVYSAAGTYTVTLVVQNQSGNADAEVKTNYITVIPTPTATFTTSGNGCTVPFGVTFINGSTTGSGVTYAWNFGNGQNSTALNPPVVNYTTAGTYNVTLTVTNAGGCSATSTQSIVVSNYQAGIQGQASACVDQAVVFQSTATVGTNAWNWNSGAGQISTQQNPSFTYSTPGTYTVTLAAQNTASGCSGNATFEITILPKPVPSFSANPTSGCAPALITFTNTSTGGVGYQWNFGNGTTFNGQNPPIQTYSSNGSYSVTLNMVGDNGCSASTTLSNLINIANPSALFNAIPVNGCDPLSVTFTQNSTTPDPGSNPIVSWQWNFGNGNTFNGQTPPPQIYTVGVYDVSLIITTQSGCKDTLFQPGMIEVGLIDEVNFSVDPQVECAKTAIDFTNLTVINAPHNPSEVTYSWNFGDNGMSNDENPTHQYVSDTGYFDVKLIVDFRGCKDTLKLEDIVYIKAPIAAFDTPISLFCNPASFPVNVAVLDEAIHGVISDDVQMIWRWGDGTTTILGNAELDDADLGSTTHDYTNYGSYSIKQVIHNFTTGCSDSIMRMIYISRVDAAFTISNDSVCKNVPFQLTSSSTSWANPPTPHPLITWSYSMGNGTTVNNGPNPTYAYPQSGTFTIILTTTNNVGCSNTATFAPMSSLELPLASITADDNAGCVPFLVTFTNNSIVQGNGVPLESFLFTFSDNGSTQSTTNVGTSVTHTFITEGNFNVSLVATDEFGCNSLPVSTPIVITKPIANFTIPQVVCDEELVNTSNTSTGANPLSYEWFIDGNANSTSLNVSTFFDETASATSSHVVHDFLLIVTDVNGCKDTLEQEVVISTPFAQIDYELSGASVNENGDFTCPPVFGNYTDETNSFGDIVSWGWVFGDGKQSSLQNPTNTYVFAGTYSISLSVTDEFGCVSDTTLVDYLTISGPTGEPDWFTVPDECGQNINFILNNPENVVDVIWNPGDGSSIDTTNFYLHVYQNIQSYYPTVTLIDANGCQIIYPMDTVVIPETGLNAFFVPNSAVLSLGETFVFDDQSSASVPIVSWSWTFGNGNDTTLNNDASQTQSYLLGGNKVITLTVVDDNGCVDSYQVIIYVDPNFEMPNVFTPNGDGSNDVFTLFADIFDSYDILIQNRWGNVVQNKLNQTGVLLWDGSDNGGALCTDGVYFYQITGRLNDGTAITKNGFVTLLE